MRCSEGKRRYPTEDKADEAMAGFINQWGEDDLLAENLNVYFCRFCDGWHLGHRGGKTKDQKLLESIRKIRVM